MDGDSKIEVAITREMQWGGLKKWRLAALIDAMDNKQGDCALLRILGRE